MKQLDKGQTLGARRCEVDCVDAQAAMQGIRSQGPSRVVTFVGFSGAGYEDTAQVREVVLDELGSFDPADTVVCAGATPDGIGMVYALALQKGFRTLGIVSSQARAKGVGFSADCEHVFVIDDPTWGGRQANGHLSPTSQAMVAACDVMIGVGGGAIAKDELEAALNNHKTVRFHPADMNHAAAREKAARAEREAPADFAGEAHALFQHP